MTALRAPIRTARPSAPPDDGTLSADARALRAAASTLGLISRSCARRCGLTDAGIERRVAEGLWIRVQPGVYRVASSPLCRGAQILAVVMAAGPGALACRSTALEVYGVPVPRRLTDRRIHVLVDHPRSTRPRGSARHRTRSIDDRDRAVHDDIPLTSPARTIVDLAAHLRWPEVVELVDELVVRRIATAEEIHARAQELHRGRKGVAAVLDATGPDAPERLRSWLERTAREEFTAAGLPAFAWNQELHDQSGRVGEVDAVLHEHRIVIELDGPRYHSTPAQRRKDRARDRRLQLSGWLILRYEWSDIVHRARGVIAEIRRAIRARQRTATAA